MMPKLVIQPCYSERDTLPVVIRAPGPLRVLTILLAISLAAPPWAHAYIDPASGSIVFQVLIAGILGALLTMRRWWAIIFRMARALLARVVGR